MIRRPPRPTRPDTLFPTRRSSDLPRRSNILDGEASHPGFEAFYRSHIRKLLLLRGGARYLAKGNYNILRLEYLLRLFPDARFVIRSEEHTSELQSLMRISYAGFCLKKKKDTRQYTKVQQAA